jgi:cold shock CspA family protein
MTNGVIVTVRDDRNFGFVRADGVDYFFHISDLRSGLEFSRQLQEQRVVFDIVTHSSKGPRATNIQPAD